MAGAGWCPGTSYKLGSGGLGVRGALRPSGRNAGRNADVGVAMAVRQCARPTERSRQVAAVMNDAFAAAVADASLSTSTVAEFFLGAHSSAQTT